MSDYSGDRAGLRPLGFGQARRSFAEAAGGSDGDRDFAQVLSVGDNGNLLQRILLPKADATISTATSAVEFCTSRMGFTSATSIETMRPDSATSSITV